MIIKKSLLPLIMINTNKMFAGMLGSYAKQLHCCSIVGKGDNGRTPSTSTSKPASGSTGINNSMELIPRLTILNDVAGVTCYSR